jgi:N-acetylmuramoyl-L-alanine amidase
VTAQILILAVGLLCGAACLLTAPTELYAETEPVVVVLDPGHGGGNEGGQYGELLEKELTLKVAEAMKEELEKYENITVYLTRTEDVEMSLEERVRFARSVEADFLFCLHFNASESHELYGAECWVSAYGDCYAKGYDFATIETEMLTSLGLYNRGIKTRISATRDADYYGIIRFSTAADLPSVIIEHCYLDTSEDAAYIDTEDWPKTYGILDATAVARYFGLKSQELQVDYGGTVYSRTVVPAEPVLPDDTAPDSCTITGIALNEEDNTILVDVSAWDEQSPLLYYAWSTDGGNTFSGRYRWTTEGASETQTGSADGTSVTFEIPASQAGTGELVVRAYNQYDLGTDSGVVDISPLAAKAQENNAGDNATPDNVIADNADGDEAGVETFLAKMETKFPAWKQAAAIAGGMLILCFAVVLYGTKGGGSRILCKGLIVLIISAGILVGMLVFLLGDFIQNDTSQELEETFVELNFYYSGLSEEQKQQVNCDPAVISYEELSYVHVLYYDFDGQVQEGELICNQSIAGDLVEIFAGLYQAQYPIEKICLIDAYDGDDAASMADDNSSCFNYRTVVGTNTLSNHAYGLAVDINPLYNPYITGTGENTVIWPEAGSSYADRSWDFPHKIDHEDLCYQLFTEHGFTWGGDWSGNKDYQHFEK